MIILNENEWAEAMITNRSLGKHPTETLRRVARYYLDGGYDKKEVREKLDRFWEQCNPAVSTVKVSDLLDRALQYALKYPSVQISHLDISKPEMEKIDALKGRQIQRLAFTLLCLAKYWNAARNRNDGWVSGQDNAIMSMANINTSLKRQCEMYWKLRECGLIEYSKQVDNTNVRVCFIEDGDLALRVTDLRNLGYQYLMYKGEPYFACENCGLVTKMKNNGKGRKPKYCKECSIAIKTQQQVNAVMKQRTKKTGNVQKN